MTAVRTWAFAWWSALTILVSAFLLFQVQPMISRIILPWFGGSPAVWSTCMLFFQVVLLAGYGYAHLTTRLFSPRKQLMIHAGLLLMALMTLPITPPDTWRPPDGRFPSLRILTVLAVSVGLPYFLVSSTGPLVQAWFARVYPGVSPYRLYALSNIGSLGALLTYPFFFEPRFTLPQQDTGWSYGFGLFALLNGIMAWWLWKYDAMAIATPAASGAPEGKDVASLKSATDAPGTIAAADPTFYTKVLWVTLPALASVAMLAVTNHLSQDVAAVPFLWVVPLSLYLISFILTFDSDFWYQRWLFAPAAMLSVLWFCLLGALPTFDTAVEKINTHFSEVREEQVADAQAKAFPEVLDDATLKKLYPDRIWPLPSDTVDMAVNRLVDATNFVVARFLGPQHKFLPPFDINDLSHHRVYQSLFFLSYLFLGCMVCHGELARLRPSSQWLTEFYLLISVGGALGGVFVALICPRIFTWYMELPLSEAGVFLVAGVTLAMLLGSKLNVSHLLRFALAAAGLSAVGALSGNSMAGRFEAEWLHWFIPLLLAAVGSLLAWALVATANKDQQIFVASLGGLFLLAALFGVVINGSVRKTDPALIDARRSFYGALQVKNDDAKNPVYRWLTHGRISHGYQLLDEARKNVPNSYYAPHSGVGLSILQHPRHGQLKVAVIGLGTGTLAAYGQKGETYRFYEIDELVLEFSDKYFTYRSDTPATTEVVLGDARISMEREEPQQYDVIAVDAFSGDAIPVHLLTRQAMDVYRKHLRPDGILVVHISNRYLDLLPVVRGMANYAGMRAGVVDYEPTDEEAKDKMSDSEWVVVTNNEGFWSNALVQEKVPDEPANPRMILWTDDFSNLFEILER